MATIFQRRFGQKKENLRFEYECSLVPKQTGIMPRRPREEDEDENYDASSVGSGRSQRSRVDGGAAADAPSEEAILAALEQETSSAQEEADILKEGADVKRFLLKQNNDVKQGTCAPSPFSPPMLVVLNQSSFLIAYLSLKKGKSLFISCSLTSLVSTTKGWPCADHR